MKLQVNNHGNGLRPMEIYESMVQEHFPTATVITQTQIYFTLKDILVDVHISVGGQFNFNSILIRLTANRITK